MELSFPKLCTVAYSKSILNSCHLARQSEDQELTFDLSKTVFISPFGTTILAGTIADSLRRKKRVMYIKPRHTTTRKFLTRIGFDRFFHLQEEPAEILDSNIQLRRLIRLDTSYTDQIISAFTRSLRMTEEVQGLLKLSLNETMTNAFEFGTSITGCYVCAQLYRVSKMIRLCITDFGQGIYRSLSTVADYSHLRNSREAIRLAVKEGVTSRSTRIGGRGLPTLLQFLGANRGRMVIISGNGKVAWDFAKSKDPMDQGMSVPFEGTSVNMRIRTDASGVYIMKGERVAEDIF